MKREVSQQAAQIAAAFAVGQSGCVIVVVTFAALAVGLWVDKHLATKPLFSLLFICGSIPLSMFLLWRIAMSITRRVVQSLPPVPPESHKE
jgi:hypothetical protein